MKRNILVTTLTDLLTTVIAAMLALAFTGCARDASEPEVRASVATPVIAAAEHMRTPEVATSEATSGSEAPTEALPVGAATPDEIAPELLGDGDLRVRRMRLAAEIEGREPLDPRATFTVSERVYAFFELRNDAPDSRELEVQFVGPGGRMTGGVALEIPGEAQRWRTWAFTRNANVVGEWEARLVTEDGEVIGRHAFAIE